MSAHGLTKLWDEGRPALNAWLSIASPFVAEIMADQGYDSVTIDLQHGAVDYGGALPMMLAMRAAGVTCMARVPWLEPGIIMKMLDAGATGIICPMVNTREQAARLVDCMRYPPDGNRSFGPTRAVFAHGADYYDTAAKSVLAWAMIETAEAMENLDEIVTTPGLDGVYIGPADLSIGVTRGRLKPGLDREEDEMQAHIKRILEAAHGAGIRAGIHCGSADYAVKAIGWGFDLATLSNDVRILAAAAGGMVRKAREGLGQGVGPEAAGGVY